MLWHRNCSCCAPRCTSQKPFPGLVWRPHPAAKHNKNYEEAFNISFSMPPESTSWSGYFAPVQESRRMVCSEAQEVHTSFGLEVNGNKCQAVPRISAESASFQTALAESVPSRYYQKRACIVLKAPEENQNRIAKLPLPAVLMRCYICVHTWRPRQGGREVGQQVFLSRFKPLIVNSCEI